MANALYDSFVNSYMTQAANQVDLDADDIRAICLDAADYTPNLATDDFLNDIPMAARVAVSGSLTGKTVTGRVFDADDVTFTGVTGDQFEYVALYKHTGVESTSRLICLFDTATGLALTPSGGDVIARWDNGANKIFRL